MSQTALITGATSGIGYELSKLFAKDHHDLILVARDTDRLSAVAEEFTKQFQVAVRVVPADLSLPDAPRQIHAEIPQVDFLVNNAGFGLGGRFSETDLQSELAMIQVNVSAVVHLTKLYLKPMLRQAQGGILNVASTAAFQPGPFMAVYYASKAFVLSFTEAIAAELEGTGVKVTAFCPGPTQTEFQERAHIQNTRLMSSKPLGVMSASEVAATGYKGFMAGNVIVIPGMRNRLVVQSLRLSPRAVVRQVIKKLQEL